MPDALFSDPRLAPLYDCFDGARGDIPAYLAIIDSLRPERIVDVGCGTGTLASLLATDGYTVTGADPAAASVAVARAKSDQVTWLQAGAAELPPLDADLALMTGNVAMVFLADEDWAAALRGVHRVLRAGGHFVFEARRPEFRGWEEWSTEPMLLDGVERRFTLDTVELPYVSFHYDYVLPDRTVVRSDSTLRFRSRDEIEESLRAAGFTTLDVRDAPDRPGREFVFIATRA